MCFPSSSRRWAFCGRGRPRSRSTFTRPNSATFPTWPSFCNTCWSVTPHTGRFFSPATAPAPSTTRNQTQSSKKARVPSNAHTPRVQPPSRCSRLVAAPALVCVGCVAVSCRAQLEHACPRFVCFLCALCVCTFCVSFSRVQEALRDPCLPVQVEAANGLRCLIELKGTEALITPVLPQLLNE